MRSLRQQALKELEDVHRDALYHVCEHADTLDVLNVNSVRDYRVLQINVRTAELCEKIADSLCKFDYKRVNELRDSLEIECDVALINLDALLDVHDTYKQAQRDVQELYDELNA